MQAFLDFSLFKLRYFAMTIQGLIPFVGFTLLTLSPQQNGQLSNEDPPIVAEQALVTLIDDIRVPAEEAGVVETIDVRDGELVEAGRVVARLRNQMHRLQVEIAENEVQSAELVARNILDIEYAEKSMAVSQKTLERSENANLRAQGAVSQTEIERLDLEFQRGKLAAERARMEREVALSQLNSKRAELNAARFRLSQREIRSPVSGVIVERLAQPGEWVNAGQPVARVIRLDRLKVQFLVDANTFDDSLIGRAVELEVMLPPHGTANVFHGIVTFVSPEVIPNRGQISVSAEIDNPDRRLRPGTTGRLTITTGK